MSEENREDSDGGWSLSDIGHLSLDILGFVPIYGEAADVANAAWYAGEGEYLDKISEALQKWQDDLANKFSSTKASKGCIECQQNFVGKLKGKDIELPCVKTKKLRKPSEAKPN